MANISENLSTVKQSLIDIKNAIIDKGITLTGNITTYAEAIDQLCLCGSATPLYIENVSDSDGVFKLFKNNSPTYTPNLIYSIDNGEWFEYDVTSLPSITVPSGSKIYLKGDNANGFNQSDSYYYRFTFTQNYNIGGYLTSLISTTEFNTVTDIPNYSFIYLFYYQETLLNTKDLITDNIINVGEYGFYKIFFDSTALITAPNFSKVTTVGKNGFNESFLLCRNLITPPNFNNLTTVYDYGFSRCFSGCTNLSITPNFSNVTTVGVSGFTECFQNCTSLTTAPRFDKVTTVGYSGFHTCFEGCLNLIIPPSFKNIVNFGTLGFYSCFRDCTKLQLLYTPNIPTWNEIIFENWVDNVATTGVLFKSETLEIPTGNNGVPTGWSVINYVE